MPEPLSQRFVRVPTDLLEALVQAHFSGGGYRILWWVIRQTYGWNRPRVLFTWYRIAQDLGMARPAVYRAGKTLVEARVLVIQDEQISIQRDHREWGVRLARGQNVARRQLSVADLNVADKQRPPLPGGNTLVAVEQPKRCPGATLFRRAKDIKDSLKTYIKTSARDSSTRLAGTTDNTQRRHLAGAAKPIPHKYERLS